MTYTKTSAEWRVEVYPRSAISKPLQDAVTLQDAFGEGMSQISGDTFFLQTPNGVSPPTPIAQWGTPLPNFDQIDSTLQFVRFPDADGGLVTFGIAANDGNGHAGFFLKRQIESLNNVLDQNQPGAPSLNPDLASFVWQGQERPDDWAIKVPDLAYPRRTFVYRRTENPAYVTSIYSLTTTARDQEFTANIRFTGIADEHEAKQREANPNSRILPASARYTWGDGLHSIHFLQGSYAAFEELRLVDGVSTWQVRRLFSEGKQYAFNENVHLNVWLLNNYLMVTLDDKTWAIRLSRSGQGGKEEPVDAYIGKGHHVWRTYGVSAAVNTSYQWCRSETTDEDGNFTPAEGTLKRTLPHVCRRLGAVAKTGFASGQITGTQQVSVAAVADSDHVEHTTTLFGPRDFNGSPFVGSVAAYWDAEWSVPSGDPLDIRLATLRIHTTTGEPGVQMSSTAQIEVNRLLLDSLDPTWQDTVRQFAPIVVYSRWRTLDTFGNEGHTDWKCVFDGYIMSDVKASAAINDARFTLDCRDAITARLSQPAALIDQRTPALDIFWLQNSSPTLYGAEAVQLLLRHFLGDQAPLFNATGNPFEFLPVDAQGNINWYPLLSKDRDRAGYVPIFGRSSQQGFNLPAPFGQDCRSWIASQMMAFDRAIFFWGFHPLVPTDRPVPIYGRLPGYLAAWGNIALSLPDGDYPDYDNVDLNNAIKSIEKRVPPNKNFSSFQVWSALGANDVMPSAVRGFDRLPASDPNSAEQTWERTFLEKGNPVLDLMPIVEINKVFINLCQVFAGLLKDELVGVEPMAVNIVIAKGDGGFRFGMLVEPLLAHTEASAAGDVSDSTIGLNGVPLRVVTVSHDANLELTNAAEAYTTGLLCRPLTASGL